MTKAKFDIKTEATRPLFAGVGVTDLAVSLVRDYVADVQSRVGSIEGQPKAFRDQAVTVVYARVDALTQDAKSRRAAIEARVAELQATAETVPGLVNSTYTELAKRGETLVERIRNQQSTQDAKASAGTTKVKAKTTKTQTSKATKTTAKKTAKKASTTAKKTTAAPKSSAKATTTAAKKTASSTAKATTDGAAKIGD